MARSISPAEEEEIIRWRFLTQTATTSGAQIPPFKKLVTKFTQFSRVAATSPQNTSELTRLYDELLADLYAIQALLQRLEASASALKQENQENAARQQTLITTIQATETEIVEKKGQLQEAREEKSRRLEYEEIRKRIAQIPARSSTKLEMDRVEAEINDLEGQMKELDVIINQRRMHFGGLVSMVDTIYRNSTTTYHQHFGDASCNTIQHESAGMNVLRSTRETEDRDAGEIHEPDGSTPMVVG